jgi:hypothetical protein
MPWHWVAAAFVLALGAATGAGYYQGRQAGAEAVQAKWDAERVQLLAAAHEAERFAREIERNASNAIHQAATKHAAQLRGMERALSNNRRELDRLRAAIATATVARRESAPAASGADRGDDDAATVAAELLGECSGTLVTLGAEAGRLAAQVISLQDYVSTILKLYNPPD